LKWNKPPAISAENAMNEFELEKTGDGHGRWRAVRAEKIEELLLAWMHPVLKHSGFS
jgi:hypothetical protein